MSFQKDKALELIEQARQNERLAHAYLITGPSGSGKEEIAIRLIEMTIPGNPHVAQSLEDLRGPTTVIVGCARTGVGVGPNNAMVRGSIPLN